MRCRNCGNTGRFVLLVELAVVAAPQTLAFSDPDWALSLECHRCASTDVAGDPALLLSTRAGR